MKPIFPASYQQMFLISPGTAGVSAHRGLLLAYSSNTNSIGLKFWDGSGVTLNNIGLSNTSDVFPIIAKQVISATGLSAFGML